MDYFLFGIGLIMLNIIVGDLVFTALSSHGAGFITGRLSNFLWMIFLKLNSNTGSRRILNGAGAVITVAVLCNWLVGIWVSCTLMICSDQDSVINVETNTAARIMSKVYYTAYTLSTMGNGDMEPGSPFWEFFTAVFSFSGLVLISIAITYLIPVLSAEIGKRKLSVYITTLGCSTDEILCNAWNGTDLKDLEPHCSQLTAMIIEHAQSHNAYPILHFYHTSNKKEAFVLNLANLDEALTIMLLHIPENRLPNRLLLLSLRRAISSYLDTIKKAFVGPAKVVPEPPHLERLRNAGMPLKENPKEIEIWYEQLKERRKILLGLVENDGWRWEDIEAGAYDTTHAIG